MTMAAAGVAKLIEECGVLQQVLGKKLAWWDTDEPHWDGSVLSERIQEEMGDVRAAIEFVITQLGLDGAEVEIREAKKRVLFDSWEATLDNNDHGIDAPCGRAHLIAAYPEPTELDW
jgi:NTP pyrophosphatase (non-canonical NTP hydrolase)